MAARRVPSTVPGARPRACGELLGGEGAEGTPSMRPRASSPASCARPTPSRPRARRFSFFHPVATFPLGLGWGSFSVFRVQGWVRKGTSIGSVSLSGTEERTGGSPPDVGSGRRGWSNPHLSFRSGKRKGRRKRFDPDIPFPLGGGGKERGTPESPTHLVPPRDTMKCVPAMDEARRREGGTNRWKWNTRPGVEMERQTLTRW